MNPQKKRRQDSEKQQLILQRNSQLHGVLLAALLAVVLLVLGLVNLLHTKRDFSENENRKLQAYPALTAASVLDGSFMSKLQSAFADQFFARDHWISAKLRIDQLLMWHQCRLKQSQNHLSMRLRLPFRNHSGKPFSANALIEDEYSVGVIPVSLLN